jgi:hypothetical protein
MITRQFEHISNAEASNAIYLQTIAIVRILGEVVQIGSMNKSTRNEVAWNDSSGGLKRDLEGWQQDTSG